MPNRRRLPETVRAASASPLNEDEEATSGTNPRPRKRVRWGGSLDTLDDVDEQEDGNGDGDGEGEETSSSSRGQDKVSLAGTCQFGRVACAYYDPVKFTIYVLEDTPDNQHFDLTKALLEQAGPDVILTSSKADDNFMDILRDHIDGSGGTFQVRPHKDFIPAKGRDRLLSLRFLSELPLVQNERDTGSEIGSEPRSAYDFMRRRRELGGDPTLQRWHASVRLANYVSIENSPLCLGAVGALLDYLARARAVAELSDEGITGLEISNLERLPIQTAMQINADALFSLQIFEDENHASIHSDKTKEGLSLFGILNNTKTTLGRALMREWFLRPSMSVDVINSRHDAIQCLVRPDNVLTVNSMHNHLNGTKNVPRILAAMKSGRAKVSDWQGLVKFAFHALLLRDALSELNHATNVEVVRKLLTALDVASFGGLGNLVNETIDWEESTNASRVCVRPRIDDELDNLKHIYNGIDAVLSKVAEQVSATIPSNYASTLNVVYFPQLGFLVCVPMQEEWKTEAGIQVLDGWSFQASQPPLFSSDSHVYFKSPEMHDMDVHIGDLHPAIVDREIEIVQVLQEKVLVYDKAISHACDVCAELDCLISFAWASRTYDYRRPQMTHDNLINIQHGREVDDPPRPLISCADVTQCRHPLQELVVDTFVPNDTFIVGGAGVGVVIDNATDDVSEDERTSSNSIVICTGANACGKSVYLKQIALIQYMAQIGCFVPAESAILGVADKIFTRVQTRESVSRVQSAFMIDLNQVSLALRNATARSLILLDEFGKGTLPTDGAGLFCGVLKHFLDRGPSCPKVVATTHFHDVFHESLLNPSKLPVNFVHMQVLLASGSENGCVQPTASSSDEEDRQTIQISPGEKITYLYKVAPGYSLHSHAIICAELFGISKRTTARAQYVSELLTRHEICQLLDEDMTDEERSELEEAEDVCRKFLAWDIKSEKGSDRQGSAKEVLAEVLNSSE